jgi:hypothetical protein
MVFLLSMLITVIGDREFITGSSNLLQGIIPPHFHTDVRTLLNTSYLVIYIATWLLKAGIAEPEKTLIARQRLGNQVPTEEHPRNNRRTAVSMHKPLMGLDTKTYWPTDRQSQCDFDPEFVGGISYVEVAEYLHRRPASCRRWWRGNQVPGGITGPPFPGGYKYRDLALQVGGV